MGIVENEISDFEQSDLFRGIEAILFASKEPVTVEKLSKRLCWPEEQVEQALQQLSDFYKESGLQVKDVGAGWVFGLASDMNAWIKTFTEGRERAFPERSKTVLITIAYHQPVTKSGLEELVGNISMRTLDTLEDMGFVERHYRNTQKIGAASWVTTNYFLEYFGIHSLDALMDPEDIRIAMDNIG